MKKWLTIGLVLVLVIGGGIWFFTKDNSQTVIAKTMTSKVEKGDLEVQISGSGSVAAIQSARIRIFHLRKQTNSSQLSFVYKKG